MFNEQLSAKIYYLLLFEGFFIKSADPVYSIVFNLFQHFLTLYISFKRA